MNTYVLSHTAWSFLYILPSLAVLDTNQIFSPERLLSIKKLRNLDTIQSTINTLCIPSVRTPANINNRALIFEID